MIPEYRSKIGFRLSKEERSKIEQLIHEGKFKNISQVIRKALDSFLKADDQA